MSCSRRKKGMLRAIGLIGAWLAAFVREDPSPRECFCNCTCSIEHRLSSAATSWQWELTKGLIFGFIGALITVGWKVVVLLIQKLIMWVGCSVQVWAIRQQDKIPSTEPELDSGLTAEGQVAVEARAREQLATLRHRQALRQNHGPR